LPASPPSYRVVLGKYISEYISKCIRWYIGKHISKYTCISKHVNAWMHSYTGA